MCPLWPFHYVILFFLILIPLFMLLDATSPSTSTKLWNINCNPKHILSLKMSQTAKINCSTSDLNGNDLIYSIARIVNSDENVADCLPCTFHPPYKLNENGLWMFSFDINGKFLGKANLRMVLQTNNSEYGTEVRESVPVSISVIRNERIIDKVFTISVAALVSVIFVNFGCALNWTALRDSLKRPVGPVIGFVSQFLFMPIISFVLGRLLFPHSIPMQLGLFFTGVSPGGGASNIWIYALGGNINLSITMTAISTLAAFVMMPLWTFSLGRYIFSDGSMGVPYSRIGSIAVGLVIPLAIGFVIQQRYPRLSQTMTKILKPFSGFLILFIIIFASITNFYLFKLFTWRILVAGLGLPFFGYTFGWLFAKVFKQPPPDSLAIAVETGVQNTGISIFMLRFSLGQPEADLTTVVPVAVALMTPVPLILLYVIRKLVYKEKVSNNDKMVVSISSEDKISHPEEEPFSHTVARNYVT